jgi:hypothetical protein
MATARPTYRLDFCPEPAPVPEINRLRSMLKALLRRFGFRAIAIVQLPQGGIAGPGPVEVTVEPALDPGRATRPIMQREGHPHGDGRGQPGLFKPARRAIE